MGKISVVIAVVMGISAVGASGLGAKGAHAQYGGDPYRTYANQMVIDRINQRRAEERVRAARGSRGKTAAPKTRVGRTPSPKKPAEVEGKVKFTLDPYSSYGERKTGAAVMEVRLTALGKAAAQPILRRVRFTPGNWVTVTVKSVPFGRYVASAQIVNADKSALPVRLATRSGEPSDPQGGDFAASQTVEIRAGKNAYGERVVIQKPTLFWFRPMIGD